MQARPILGITMGDPAGIGPEIAAKVWSVQEIRAKARLLLIGDAGIMRKAFDLLELDAAIHTVTSPSEAAFSDDALDVLDLANVDLATFQPGVVQVQCGRAAYEAVVKAAELAMAGEIDAIVTPPLNKAAMNKAGYHHDGHTGLLKSLTGAPSVTMMLVAGDFRVTHVSTHCSLRQAIDRAVQSRILEVIRLTNTTCQQMGIAEPRLAVAGINPHSGEGGLFGDEEEREIQPAIDAALAESMDVALTPQPPDTVFFRMARSKAYDAVVAMYHDQGHIPTKLLAFDEGVNVSLGLPIIRTSVDHGTAFDIAWKGMADPTSLRCAIDVAMRMAQPDAV